MPDYLAPGVYVEEIPSGVKSIAGVSTSTAALIGPTRTAPTDRKARPVTSFDEFEQAFGRLDELRSGRRYTTESVRAFFDNGGTRLHVIRLTPPSATRTSSPFSGYRAGLRTLEGIEDVSTVLTPAAAALDEETHLKIVQLLKTHCEKMQYRVGLVDIRAGSSVRQAIDFCSRIRSNHLAAYHPWLVQAPPGNGSVPIPPSGAIAGIFARNDRNRGVHKAPANLVIKGISGFDLAVGIREQQQLNPSGINCLRQFDARGRLVWGARTLSTLPEWKYLAVRRFTNFLEASIERGTQWVVFEPNDEPLWARVRQAVENFLNARFREGALAGATPRDAYFVRCDRTTMTQSDLDNGRLILEIGFAPVKPAEFVIVRIAHHTATNSA